MTDTLNNLEGLATYPMARQQTCPFDPPAELRQLRADQPLTRVRIWDGSTPWLITGYDDQRAVLADHRFSADSTAARLPGHDAVGEGAARPEPVVHHHGQSGHDRYRRMFTRDFMIKRVEAMRPRIQSIVDELIDDHDRAGPARRPGAVARAAGAVAGDLRTARRPLRRPRVLPAAQQADGDPIDDPAPSVRASEELVAYLADLLSAKDREPGRRPALPAGRRPGAAGQPHPQAGRRHRVAAAGRRTRDDRQHDRARHARAAAQPRAAGARARDRRSEGHRERGRGDAALPDHRAQRQAPGGHRRRRGATGS